MSSTHLSTGSVEPPRTPGLLRIYANRFCPFAMRARSVLAAKEIPHDLVLINLVKKPEWYFQIHPEGKVPALLDGEKIIVESLDICEYLENKFPQKHPLYPSDPVEKQKDKEFIKEYVQNPRKGSFLSLMPVDPKKSLEELATEFTQDLQPLEEFLKSRGNYFGGDEPHMVDYVLWSFFELEIILKRGGKQLPLKNSDIPQIRAWAMRIKNRPELKDIVVDPKKRMISIQAKRKGEDIDLDALLKEV